MPTNKPRPWVLVAAPFERVLVEADSAVSAIRLIDRMQAEIEAPEELPDDALGARFEFTILFALRSEVSMKFDLKMRAIGPTGVAEKEFSYPLTLPGDGRGHNVVVAASIGAKRSGWYWMDVYADEFGMLVRIPLELVIQRKRR